MMNFNVWLKLLMWELSPLVETLAKVEIELRNRHPAAGAIEIRVDGVLHGQPLVLPERRDNTGWMKRLKRSTPSTRTALA